MRKYLGINVYEAAKKRIAYIFDNFENIYLSFSGGKDSTVMLHMVAAEARKRKRKFGLLCIDMEAQYKHTIDHIESMYKEYSDCIIPFWVALPIVLTNAVSSYEPRWICWDKNKEWTRDQHKLSITDIHYFPFFKYGMEFEEFIFYFGKWYSAGNQTACFIGIRTEESYNRLLKLVVKKNREFYNKKQWILKQKLTGMDIYSVHPIYDWKVKDIWAYHGKYGGAYNKIYDLMQQAGVTLYQQRLCQPYGYEQRKGLYLFHILEPETWSKILSRVNGVNSGAEFVKYSGNISGQIKIYLPEGHTWRSFALLILKSMPKKLADHYDDKIHTFLHWWSNQGGYYDSNNVFHGFYGENIPDCVDQKLENAKKAPSWRRICKSLLRNDYWCKGMSFVQNSSPHYERYKTYMMKRKQRREYIPLWRR